MMKNGIHSARFLPIALKPVKTNVTRELLDWGRMLSGGNTEMVKLLRLCVDYGEERILSIRQQLPQNLVPTVDMIRSQLHEAPESNVLYFKHEIPITPTVLTKYDEKCGGGCTMKILQSQTAEGKSKALVFPISKQWKNSIISGLST